MKSNDMRGIEIGNGILLAPHPFVSDEDEEINYKPVTPENYELKVRAVREWCKYLDKMENEPVMAGWASGHIMCILKYGDGYEQWERKASDMEPVLSAASQRPRRWWRWWKRG